MLDRFEEEGRAGLLDRFKDPLLFIANALKQHHIDLKEVDDGLWSIYFCRVLLALEFPRFRGRLKNWDQAAA